MTCGNLIEDAEQFIQLAAIQWTYLLKLHERACENGDAVKEQDKQPQE